MRSSVRYLSKNVDEKRRYSRRLGMSTASLTQNSPRTIGPQPRDECIKYVLDIRSIIVMGTRVVWIEKFMDIEHEFAGISIGIGNLQKEWSSFSWKSCGTTPGWTGNQNDWRSGTGSTVGLMFWSDATITWTAAWTASTHGGSAEILWG